MPGCRIVEGGLDDSRVMALVEHHSRTARAATPGGASHTLAADRLGLPDIRFFAAWIGEEAVGTGALRTLSGGHGEIKSMHTIERARGQGIGGAMLAHIECQARGAGLGRLSLETHPGEYFAAALALYRKHGFAECPPFGEYRASPASLFMTKDLS